MRIQDRYRAPGGPSHYRSLRADALAGRVVSVLLPRPRVPHRVRLDFVAKQVPSRRNREVMREAVGTDAIPSSSSRTARRSRTSRRSSRIRERHERPTDADTHREKWFEDAPRRDPKHVLT